jgi:hypothetical protein
MPTSLRLPREGEPTPHFTLPATDGATIHLGIYPKPVGLILLRHLG